MGPYLAKPETSIHTHDEENDRFCFCTSEMQGWRKTQEDAHSAILDYLEKGSNDSAFFAVFDGHGGEEVSKYCALHFPTFLKKRLAFADGNYLDVIRQAFLEFDRTLKEPHVIAELRKLASMDDMEDIGDDEPSLLRKEAEIPIEELVKDADDGDETTKESKNGESSKDEPAVSSSSTAGDGEGDKPVDTSDVKTEEVKESSKNGEVDSANADEKSDDAKESSSKNGKVDSTAGPSGSGEAGGSSSASNGEGSSKSVAEVVDADLAKPSSSGISSKSALSKGVKSDIMRQLNQHIYEAFFKNCGSDDDDEEDDEDDDEEGESGSDSEDDDDDDDEEEDDEEDSEDDDDFQGIGGLDSHMSNAYTTPGGGSGCTAIAAVVLGNTLYVANVGDSRCVLSRDGKAVEMSEDHKPEDEGEKKRIVKAGGEVTADGRVNGGLNLSRAIGDHLYKKNESLSDVEQMVTALPDIRTHEIDFSKDKFMFLACDGIWNSMNNQEVVDFISERLKSEMPLKTICEELFNHCLAPNTEGDGSGCDNMTCILVKFKKTDLAESMKRALEDDEEEEQANNHSESKKIKTEEESAPAASSSSSAAAECVAGPSSSSSS